MPNIHEIAAALKARRSGAGFVARCPAHEDRTPSLALCERSGRILLHCHAGCRQADVIAALRERGLWPELGARRPHPRGDPDRAFDTLRAAYWVRSALLLAEQLLETLGPADAARRPLSALMRDLRLGDEVVLAEYRWWREHDPALTAALVYAGRLSDARLQRRAAKWIQGDAHAKL